MKSQELVPLALVGVLQPRKAQILRLGLWGVLSSLQRLLAQAASCVAGQADYAKHCRDLWRWSGLGWVHLFINFGRKKLSVLQCLLEIQSSCFSFCLAAMIHNFPPGIGKLARVRWVHTHCLDFKFSCFNCFLINNQKLFQSKHTCIYPYLITKPEAKLANSGTNDSMFVLNIFSNGIVKIWRLS